MADMIPYNYSPQTQYLSTPKSSSNYMDGYNSYSFGLPTNYDAKPLYNFETRSGTGYQTPTGVIDPRSMLSSNLKSFGSKARGINAANLGYNFARPGDFANGLQGGIDYFGRMGIAEGMQNIGLQREAQNRQLGTQLSRQMGNEGLLGVLQNQNLLRSALAGNQLYGEAQKGTAERMAQQLELKNQYQQLVNQARLAQQQSNIARLQPQQNLLELLTGLQGQYRGIEAGESQYGGRNFK